MKKFIILVDSTSDLCEELRKKYDIEHIKGYITYPDGKELQVGLTWDNIDKDEFFRILRSKVKGFSTSPATVEAYKLKYEEYLKQGYDVLYISLSSALSGTYDFAFKAKEAIDGKYENKVICIDSRRYSTACGALAIRASVLRSEGKSIDDVAEEINRVKYTIHQMGPMDDLTFLAKKGRISHAKAFMGSLIGVKPLGDFDVDGKTTVLGKAKGEKKAFDATIEYVRATATNIEEQTVFLAHTNRPKQIEYFKNLVQEKLNPKEIIVGEIYPINCINIGPGLTAIYYYGNEISSDLENEKKVMDNILNK